MPRLSHAVRSVEGRVRGHGVAVVVPSPRVVVGRVVGTVAVVVGGSAVVVGAVVGIVVGGRWVVDAVVV